MASRKRQCERESERVRVRGKGDNLKSKVHKSRKYDFLFGDDEQKDNFLNQTDRERETETATETETESERERDSSKMSMTQRRTTWCWQCVCVGGWRRIPLACARFKRNESKVECNFCSLVKMKSPARTTAARAHCKVPAKLQNEFCQKQCEREGREREGKSGTGADTHWKCHQHG